MPTCLELSEMLEQYIKDHQITGKMPGILKLGREFGVNRITLGKAFHFLEEKGILTICGTKGTFVNQKTKTRRHHIIGIVGINSEQRGGREIIAIMNKIANPAGYHIIGITFEESLFLQNPRVLLNFPVDAVLFRYSFLLTKQAELLHREGIPIVSCAERTEFPWLDVGGADHFTGYSMILDHLMALGHRRIAFLEFDRLEEYHYYLDTICDVFRMKLGIDFDQELFYTKEMGETLFLRHGQEYWNIYPERAWQHFFNRTAPPTAIIAPYPLARQIMVIAEKKGYRIPEDLSIVSANYVPCPQDYFTGIRFDEIELFAWGIKRLLGRLAGKIVIPEHFVLRPMWFEGSTTAKVNMMKIKSKEYQR